RLVEPRRDVDLGHSGGDRRGEPGVGHPGGAVQHQRDGHGPVDLRDQVLIEHGIAGEHRVRATDRHGQRVHPGRGGIPGRVTGAGPGPGGVHPVLAADLADLRLDPAPPPSPHTPAPRPPRAPSAAPRPFCSYAAADASYMPAPRPAPPASRTGPAPVAWSGCPAPGTAAAAATASAARAIGCSAPW